MLRKTTIAAAVVLFLICAGCQSHAQSKEAAKLRWQKNSAQIKLTLAQQQYDNEKYTEAEKTINECIRADPEMPMAYLLLGKLLLTDDRAEKATEQLQLAVGLNENLDEGWYWLGVAAQQSRQNQLALSAYKKAMSLNSDNIDYILAVAEVLTAQKKDQDALRVLQEKLETKPRDVSLKVAAADLLFRTGKNEQAIELYRQAMLMTDENEDVAESLGYCYVFSGKWDDAGKIFYQLAERYKDKLAPEENDRWIISDQRKKKVYLKMAALCSMKSGRYDRAVDCYSKLTVEQRDDAEVWVKMGQAALGAAMTEKAIMCGRKANSLRPGYPDAVVLIGSAQYADGDYAAALESFNKVSSNTNNAGFTWLMRARCYEKLGRMDKAEQAYKTAMRLNPDSALAALLAKGRDLRR